MIILNKKRITIITLSVFISVFAFIFSMDKQNTVPTVSLPISGKTIVVDAGHGKPDEGAESSTGTTEAETNYKTY